MGIRRACSYQASIRPPQSPGSYSALLLTISQNGQNLINKTAQQLTLTDTQIIVKLTQAETKQFTAGVPAYMQLRCYSSAYNAPGSKVWALDVYPALNDEVLP